MAPPIPALMPDVESLAIAWLKAKPDLANAHVGSHVPKHWDPRTDLVVRVVRSGGFTNNSIPFWKDNVRIDLTCFGPDKAKAWDLNAIVRRYWLHSLKWETAPLGGTCQVMDTTEYVGPQWLDSTAYPPAGRYLIQVGVSIHPIS